MNSSFLRFARGPLVWIFVSLSTLAAHAEDCDLMNAIYAGDTAKIASLAKAGADLNALSCYGKLPMLEAVTAKRPDSLKTLIDLGAKIDQAASVPYYNSTHVWTALHLAAANDLRDRASILVAAHANLNAVDDTGMTPLMQSIVLRYDLGAVAMDLIAAGTDLNLQDRDGETALMMAADNAHDDGEGLDLIRAMLAAHADLKRVDKKGQTALDHAVLRRSLAAIRLLQSAETPIPAPSEAPLRPSLAVSKAGFGCLVDREGLKCWGHFTPALQKFVASPFTHPTRVAAFGSLLCVLDDRGVVCMATDGSAAPVPGFNQPTDLSVGNGEVCALDADGVRCIAPDLAKAPELRIALPGARFLAGNYSYWDGAGWVCAMNADTTKIYCTDPEYPYLTSIAIPKALAPLRSPRALRVQNRTLCVLDTDALKCWDRLSYEPPHVLRDPDLRGTRDVLYSTAESFEVCGNLASGKVKCWKDPRQDQAWEVDAYGDRSAEGRTIVSTITLEGGGNNQWACGIYPSKDGDFVSCEGATDGDYTFEVPAYYRPELEAKIDSIQYRNDWISLGYATILYPTDVPPGETVGVYDGLTCHRNDRVLEGKGNLQTGTGDYYFNVTMKTPPRGRFLPTYWPTFLTEDGKMIHLDGTSSEVVKGIAPITDFARVVNFDSKFNGGSWTKYSKSCALASKQVHCWEEESDWPYAPDLSSNVALAGISDARRVWAGGSFACVQDGDTHLKCPKELKGTSLASDFGQFFEDWDLGFTIRDALVSDHFVCASDGKAWTCRGEYADRLEARLNAFSPDHHLVAAPITSTQAWDYRTQLCAYGNDGLTCWTNGEDSVYRRPSAKFLF